METDWTVYVLVSESGRTYVGCTTDPERRLAQHNGDLSGGAKATRPWRPWRIGVTYGPYTKSDAHKVEYKVKRLRGLARLEWAAAS